MSPNCTNCSRPADQAFAGMYALIFVVGLPLNIAALCIFVLGRAGRSNTITYMKNLAACDLLLLASLPLRVCFYGWRPQLPPLLCEVVGMLLLVNMYGSIFLLTCLSWDRCLAVCFPLSPRAQAVRRQAKYICAGVWALSIAGTIPTYITQRKKGQRMLCFDERPLYITARGVPSTMALAFALPLTIMVTCSCQLLRAVHRSGAVQMELVNGTKIRQMVVTNVGIFLGCFLPYHVAVLLYQAPQLQGECLDTAYQCALLLACANAALDPLAYYFATETFQHLVPLDYLLRGRGSHSNNAWGTGNFAQPLRSQGLFGLPSGVETLPLEGAEATRAEGNCSTSICEVVA
ncbi:lysophosphatidic acid receptor 6-like [Zootoca vivipara]|uniref:lysophosphatidic acid receptor 6-like n=1 Tax=Zootoca vivipara TaxID=8524 RepID=UPI00293BAB29|nr:lysophosphatidic acid receptor 6-like [Zootoca vivipara]